MRGTRAISAVQKLKERTGNPHYAAIGMPGGLFRLVDRATGIELPLSEPLPLDAFVAFVDAMSPAKPKRVSKLDVAFEAQIKRSKR
ncbi:hypothetical protein [Trinickia sp.]|uniref:hypothetical protein n=1 Tax=Trinickia sp. TaxID=2571163 RepID=UPI003F7D5FBC